MEDSVNQKIEKLIQSGPVVVFMKGSPDFPNCGFSFQACRALKDAGAKEIIGVDVLADPEIRQGIKSFTQWPTIPQIFLNGKFIGGCDIVTEMAQRGELEAALKG